MKALVTGATGFIGANVTRQLISRGYQVRTLVRKGSNRRNLEGLDVEIAIGDLCDPASLAAAVAGCDYLFHVAAAYTFWTPRPREVYETNVTGTRNILDAAVKHGLKKIVYTSSESAIKIMPRTLGNEAELSDPDTLPGHYKRSKCLAELAALEMCHEGAPVVVVSPTTPIGPYDIKPTPTGQIVVRYLNRRMPAWLDTGLNIVNVEDVAAGHVLALEKGRVGERYVLGNRNLTLREVFRILEQITAIPAPRLRIPHWLALGAGYWDECVNGRLRHKQPSVSVDAVKAAHRIRFFDCSKAVSELGMPQTSVERAFEKAVKWFRENGYVTW